MRACGIFDCLAAPGYTRPDGPDAPFGQWCGQLGTSIHGGVDDTGRGVRTGMDPAPTNRSGDVTAAYMRKREEITDMPAPRRTTRHIEAVEAHGEEVRLLVVTWEEVTSDGRIEPHEGQLLDRHISRIAASFTPLPAEASVIDNAVGLVKGLLDTMEVTPWIERRAREAAADEQRLADDGVLEPIAA